MGNLSDIRENDIQAYDPALMLLLLLDRTRTTEGESHNIIWATDNFIQNGPGYAEWGEITVESVTGWPLPWSARTWIYPRLPLNTPTWFPIMRTPTVRRTSRPLWTSLPRSCNKVVKS